MERIVLFPFADHYIVITYYLQEDFDQEPDAIIQQLEQGSFDLSETDACNIESLDNMIESLRFTDEQFSLR